ncbi:hypothetical protein BDV06DRAFT_233681 [Aspergillus oleicola]
MYLYSPLRDSEPDSAKLPGQEQKQKQKPWRHLSVVFALTVVAALAISAALFVANAKPKSSCIHSRLRREWRTLSPSERLSYLAAAQCLTRTPSINDNGTIHDEFALLHSRIGNYSHNAAPFLPWHRYFVHLYEKALREHCGYEGSLPYWDWTLDYQNILDSPIWQKDIGFGSTATEDNPRSINGGCVTDGPFAHFTPLYYEGELNLHCLSRGFRDEATVQRVGNLTMRPDILQRLVLGSEADLDRDSGSMVSYFDFLLRVETASHLTIPYVVQGDFARVTAPNDPVFFLHHAQVDRLWWSWQSVSAHRRNEYNGPARYNDDIGARVDDVLEFGNFGENTVVVRDVMDAEKGTLCYRYDRSVLEGL